MQGMNAVLIDSIAACGDVNRNVMAAANPVESRVHQEVYDWSVKLSEHLKPKTRAYHEIWLNGEKLVGPAEEEPILGQLYLPRKFKTAVVVPPHNDVDIYSQDLGFIAILDKMEEGKLLGFNLTVGGGLGATHGEPQTYPRLADLIGFLTPDQVLKVAETVVMIQRDFGDRTDRKHARFKYTIADRGVDWFKAELFKRLGLRARAAAPVQVHHAGRPLRLAARTRWPLAPDAAHRIRPRRRRAGPALPHGPRKDRGHSPGRFPAHREPEPHHRQRAGQRVHEHRPHRGRSRPRQSAVHLAGAPRCAGLRGAAHLRPGHGRSRALSTGVRRSRRRAAGQTWIEGHSADRAHHRLPQWLRASVSRGDRAHRPRSRPLHACASAPTPSARD